VTERKCFVFNFADVEVREREFLLIKGGERISVEPKAFRVLIFLLRNPGRLVGKDEVGDKDAWRVKMTTKNGDVRYYLFDATTFLLLKWEGQRQAQGKVLPVQSYFRDYRDVGGMKFAFAIDSGSSATDLTQKIIIEKIELNPQVPESEFAKPLAPGEAAPPAVPNR